MTRLRSTPFSPSNFQRASRVCISSQVLSGEANKSDTSLSSSASAVYNEIGWCLASSPDSSVLKRSCVVQHICGGTVAGRPIRLYETGIDMHRFQYSIEHSLAASATLSTPKSSAVQKRKKTKQPNTAKEPRHTAEPARDGSDKMYIERLT